MFDACIVVNPDEVMEHLSTTYPRARKRHVCCECLHAIKPGERYERQALVDDGDVMVYETCIPCSRIRGSLFSHGYYFGRMWNDVHEQFCLSRTSEEEDFCICPEQAKDQ